MQRRRPPRRRVHMAERDNFTVPEDDIKQTSSVLTVVGGEIVHDTGEIST
ncbi:MAG: hypothetical protein ACOC9R_01140 [bacterium]